MNNFIQLSNMLSNIGQYRNINHLTETFNPSYPVLFPGQGSQFVGMATKLCDNYPIAKDMFSQASQILNINLLELCSKGPKELLNSTKYSQPAIYVASLAAMEVYKHHNEHAIYINPPTVALGLSLGEYTALCYCGVFSFIDGLYLTKTRGEEMQKACDLSPGTMVVVVGVDIKNLLNKCQEIRLKMKKFVYIGNYLGPQQYVLSGDIDAVDAVLSNIIKDDINNSIKITKLSVSGAFHSPLMKTAQYNLENVINNTQFSYPQIPIIMNVNGNVIGTGTDNENERINTIEMIKANLIKQLTMPVQWEKSLHTLLSGTSITTTITSEHIIGNTSGIEATQLGACQYTPLIVDPRFKLAYEVGPGNSCSSTLKRVFRRGKVISYDCI